MEDNRSHVTLGRHPLPAYAQSWSRIVKRLGRVIDSFRAAAGEDGSFDPATFVRDLQLSGKLYYVLETFIPNIAERMPEYELLGFVSKGAFDAGDYDESQDVNDGERQSVAPTFPQFLDALDAIVDINGGKRFIEMLGKALKLEMIKAELTLAASDAIAEWREARNGSPSSSGANGASQPTTSGTTAPTSEGSDTTESEDDAARSGIPQLVSA